MGRWILVHPAVRLLCQRELDRTGWGKRIVTAQHNRMFAADDVELVQQWRRLRKSLQLMDCPYERCQPRPRDVRGYVRALTRAVLTNDYTGAATALANIDTSVYCIRVFTDFMERIRK